MKRVLAVAAGFVFTLGIFAAGAASTFFLLIAEPVDVTRGPQNMTELWSVEPRRVEPEDQDFVRVAGPADAAAEEGAAAAPDLDMMATAALPDEPAAPPAGGIAGSSSDDAANRAISAHVAWCEERYRSYRPRDNSYTPYSGGRRTCVSPYSSEIMAADGDDALQFEASASSQIQNVADGASAGAGSEDHLRACASRYRSYRAADNSYQPYGGGPRRQCL